MGGRSTEAIPCDAPVTERVEAFDEFGCLDDGWDNTDVRVGSLPYEIELPATRVERHHVAPDDPILPRAEIAKDTSASAMNPSSSAIEARARSSRFSGRESMM